MNNFRGKVSFIWSVADLLREPHRPNRETVLTRTEQEIADMLAEVTE